MQKCDKQHILLQGWQKNHVVRKKIHDWQNKTCCKQEDKRLVNQNIWQTRSYIVGKIKHVVSKKLHDWQSKTCCKKEVTRLAKQIMLQTRRYTVGKTKHMANKKIHVGKIKHVVNKKLHGWQNKACCKQEDKRLAKQNML
jgi:hypothetical protein